MPQQENNRNRRELGHQRDDGTPGMSIASAMQASWIVMAFSTAFSLVIATVLFPSHVKNGNLFQMDWPVILFVVASTLIGTAAFWYLCRMDWLRVSSQRTEERLQKGEFAIHFLGRTWRWKRGKIERMGLW